jgi:hypothetical protein
MAIWQDCINQGLSTLEARFYAKLEIMRLVKTGQLSSDLSDITPIESADQPPLKPSVIVPSEDDDAPIEVGVLSPVDGGVMGPIAPLAPNPAHAPSKVCGFSPSPGKARTIGNLVPNFAKVLQLPEPATSIAQASTVPSEDRAARSTVGVEVKPADIPPRYPFARKKTIPTWGQGYGRGYYDDDERWAQWHGYGD